MTPEPTHLYYYKCSLCATTMCSIVKAKHRPCNGCFRWMRYQFSVEITTDEQRALAAKGIVFNPHPPEPRPWVCGRCGVEQPSGRTRFYRVDGVCCRDCVLAESHPPLLTLEQMAARKAEQDALVREDQERLEAAHRAAEGQQ